MKTKQMLKMPKLDIQRIESYQVNYQRKDNWVILNEFHPISRFYTPPNNFLDLDNQDKILRKELTMVIKNY